MTFTFPLSFMLPTPAPDDLRAMHARACQMLEELDASEELASSLDDKDSREILLAAVTKQRSMVTRLLENIERASGVRE